MTGEVTRFFGNRGEHTVCRHTLTIITIEYQLMNPAGPVARVSIFCTKR
jgi:hypothetical protein